MATYNLISSQTLSSSASSVTFSSIPQTYTDLVLKVSARSDWAEAWDYILLRYNSVSVTTNYSYTDLFVYNGSTIASSNTSNGSSVPFEYIDGSGATSYTFSNTEVYIPNYTAAQNKPFSTFSVMETNDTTNNRMGNVANLWSNTAAITSINLFLPSSRNFVQYSSFYLYGINNS